MNIISELLSKETMQTIITNPCIVVAFVGAIIGYNFSLVCQEKLRSKIRTDEEERRSDIQMKELRNRTEDERVRSIIRTDEEKRRVYIGDHLEESSDAETSPSS